MGGASHERSYRLAGLRGELIDGSDAVACKLVLRVSEASRLSPPIFDLHSAALCSRC